jgi:hypothetical protein
MTPHPAHPALVLGSALLGLLALAVPGQADEAAPATAQRPHQISGMLMRWTSPPPALPPDPRRDTFQGTRYDDEHDNSWLRFRPNNSALDGGMYGRLLTNKCTATVAPYFVGSTGSTISDCCRGLHPLTGRWVGNFIHPFKPVGMYYDRGVYAPIYDTQLFVPGPGPFPWNAFFKRPTGG